MEDVRTLGPLGLLSNFEISAGAREKLEKLADFSLDREIRVLSEDERFTLDDQGLPTLAREFKRFMSLALLFPQPKYNFAPSKAVDRVWHETDTGHEKIRGDVHGCARHVRASPSA
jgi:hypothetical protein